MPSFITFLGFEGPELGKPGALVSSTHSPRKPTICQECKEGVMILPR